MRKINKWDVFEVLVLTITFSLMAGCATWDSEKFRCYEERTDGRITCDGYEQCIKSEGNSPSTCSTLCKLLCNETVPGTCYYELRETSPGKYRDQEVCKYCFEYKKERSMEDECLDEDTSDIDSTTGE